MQTARSLVETYLPIILHDEAEPFPIRYLGCTVFTEKGNSQSFRNLVLDPKAYGAQAIIEYAIYYDYDIQHLYDLEHIWVAAGEDGGIAACWGSFHGMRLRVDRLDSFRMEETHPILYAEPGKHAFLPDPNLFLLHDQFPACCNTLCGGGLLIPPFLRDVLHTDETQDARIRAFMKKAFSFEPTNRYTPEPITPEQLIPWETLLARIPEQISIQLERI